MSSKPLQRCLEKARKEGYAVWIVERFISHPPFGTRIDLFNLFDAVAIHKNVAGVLGIQACPTGDINQHIAKIMEGYIDKKGKTIPPNPYLESWKVAGNRAVIWGWSLRCENGVRGARKVWTCKEVWL